MDDETDTNQKERPLSHKNEQIQTLSASREQGWMEGGREKEKAEGGREEQEREEGKEREDGRKQREDGRKRKKREDGRKEREVSVTTQDAHSNSVRSSASKLARQTCRCRICAIIAPASKRIALTLTLARGMPIERRQKNVH